MSNAWAYAIALSSMGALIGLFAKIIYDSIKKDRTIASLEYDKEKNESKADHKDDDLNTIIARLKSKFGWRDGSD